MSNDGVHSEKVRVLSQQTSKYLCDMMWEHVTPKLEKFFALLGIDRESGQFVVRGHDSAAWLSVRGEAIRLETIHTHESQRKQGCASQLLQAICSAADATGMTLTLRAEPKDRKIGLEQKGLIEWYGRHGFEGGPDKMKRHPR